MNQTCKVCGEPAAGFHFGAFTCEGCKSFFGRSYNNISSISECKNNGECIINKKNRTTCKACRLKKCLLVGMSKSGSRYGRRSNWFKIHCLLQEQQQEAAKSHSRQNSPYQENLHMLSQLGGFSSAMYPTRPKCSKDELVMLTLGEHASQTAPPSVSSPESHNSDSSIDHSERRRLHYPESTQSPQIKTTPSLFPPSPHLLFPGHHIDPYFYHHNLLKPPPIEHQLPFMHSGLAANNNTQFLPNHNNKPDDEMRKRFYLDFLLKSQKIHPIKHETEEHETVPTTITPPRSPSSNTSSQDSPIDLSVKSGSHIMVATKESHYSAHYHHSSSKTASEEEQVYRNKLNYRLPNGTIKPENNMKLADEHFVVPSPLDLTTKI